MAKGRMKLVTIELDATKDEDEQRALEEDVTGKILWLFCNLMGLWEIGEIIRGTFRTDPDDDQVHLRRIMADAGAGTSKHQLWLAARAAQLMNRSGVTAAEDQFNLDTPTAFPRTSHQMPSASLASIP
ncbi:hypothetical protein M404DRAFT_875267 [Pisolithus tinctorius Marx 270]|uniref:Uncharacterized protein n=1 Tax=Pisolithus tinctorius Marx 270 TaxID=870435 RepID=A0A0C3JNN8_PISTI|nr:hypothetical protein M404DRAFT_875267 [Pisolithus tinctorius Marx 270]